MQDLAFSIINVVTSFKIEQYVLSNAFFILSVQFLLPGRRYVYERRKTNHM